MFPLVGTETKWRVWNKLIYMLTCEGDSIRVVSRFLVIVLSAQRYSFVKLWRELNKPGGEMH